MQQILFPSIWSASPCALNYSNRAPSFQKSRRFQFNSIYYKDDPHKPKNQQSILVRPEMILHQFRKKIKQATKNVQTAGNPLKKKKKSSPQNNLSVINGKASQVTDRLYQEPSNILLMKYDLNGNRSSFCQHSNQNEKQNLEIPRSLSPKQLNLLRKQHKSCQNVYITSTFRTDFGRPLNFHPGPGSYFITQDQDQSGSLLKIRASKKSILQGGSQTRISSDLSKSIPTENSQHEEQSLKKTFEHITKKYCTVEIQKSPQRRKNVILKRMKYSNKRE